METWIKLGIDEKVAVEVDKVYKSYASVLNTFPGGPFEPGKINFDIAKNWNVNQLRQASAIHRLIDKDERIHEYALVDRAGRVARGAAPFQQLREFSFFCEKLLAESKEYDYKVKKIVIDMAKDDGFDIRELAGDSTITVVNSLMIEIANECNFSLTESSYARIKSFIEDETDAGRIAVFDSLRSITTRALVRFGYEKMTKLFSKGIVNVSDLKTINPILYKFLLYETTMDLAEEIFGVPVPNKRVYDGDFRVQFWADKETVGTFPSEIMAFINSGKVVYLEVAGQSKDQKFQIGSKVISSKRNVEIVRGRQITAKREKKIYFAGREATIVIDLFVFFGVAA